MSRDGKFLHRPISINVDEVSAMETVRTLPAEETYVTVNVKLNQQHARALARLILEKGLVDEPFDVVTVTLQGTMK